MGGFNGRALACGDQLSIGSDFEKKAVTGVVRPNVVSLPQKGALVRIIPGPNNGDLGVDGLKRLCSTRYVINPKSNRMGYRLDGDSRFSKVSGERISTAVPIGTVQVPPRGEPIILMSDHQTTGGYSHVATVITADLGTVGQLVPGNWIKFDLCDHEVAIDALLEQERIIMS
jgi:antagonist of KipI